MTYDRNLKFNLQGVKAFFVCSSGNNIINSSICDPLFQINWSKKVKILMFSGAFLFHELAQQILLSNDLDNEMDELLQDFEIKCNRSILHSVLFY